MNTELPGITRNIFKKKRTVRFIAVGLVVILAAGAVFTFLTLRKNKAASTGQPRLAQVTKGSISVSITGSAPVESADRREMSPKVTSKVEKVYFKEGDDVKAGALLYELDDADAQLTVENTKNSIAQTQLSQDSNRKSVSGLTVRAPFGGQVNNVAVKAGDTIGKGAAILTLVDVSKLKVTLPFSGEGVKSVKTGSRATVYLQDLMQSVEGSVTYVSSRPYATASGGEVYNVEITMDNPGSLQEGIKANAEITTASGALSSVDSGALSYINTVVLKSDAGGTIKSIKVADKQFVSSGELLLELENDDLKLNVDTTDLKLQSLQRQLEIQQEQLTYYKITAPFDGTITSQNVKEGDTVKQGDVLGVVSDMTHMQFTVTIDELDIAKVAVGQKVNITLDALPETSTTPLTGVISKTAMEGSSSNGVTTYPVTISIDKSEKLKAGMYANAEIFISQKDNILMVPIEAVQKVGNRSFVMVSGGARNAGAGTGRQGSANGGFVQRNRANSSGSNASGGNPGSSTGGTPGSSTGGNSDSGTGGTPGSSAGSNPGSSTGDTAGGAAGGPAPGSGVQAPEGQASGDQTPENQGAGGWQGARNGSQGSSGSSAAGQRRSAAASNSYYANAVMTPVETGINNDTYIEITSGLQEGQTVILPQTVTSSGQQTTTQRAGGNAGFGFMGGVGGGATRAQQPQRSFSR